MTQATAPICHRERTASGSAAATAEVNIGQVDIEEDIRTVEAGDQFRDVTLLDANVAQAYRNVLEQPANGAIGRR